MSKQFTFEAIGTHFWIEIFDEISDQELEATISRLELLSSTFNQHYSRFTEDSDISKINKNRSLISPSDELLDILEIGKQLYRESFGTFNLLTGHILESRGYDASYSFVAKEMDGADAPSTCNPLTDLTVTKDEVSLGCGNIDIGGYGKGYLIDKIVRDLQEHNIKYFLVNGGGDMYATSEKENPITIYLEHPTEPGKYLMETTLLNQGFAASSPFKRQWKSGEKTYTHIVSEHETPLSATFIKADTATNADAFGTASLLLSNDALLDIAENKGFAFARFTPATSEFWQTNNFGAI